MSRGAAPRLGRGLAALLGEEPDVNSRDLFVQSVLLSRLDQNPNQPRGPIGLESLEELATSIRSQGILQPLLVRPSAADPERFEIIAGERRWRAAGLAGLEEVPCIVQPLTDEQSAAAALVENLQRLDLNAIEEAEGYGRLQMQYGLTQDRIADIVGKSRSHVANTLRLMKLPASIHEHIRSGALTAGHARALLSHPDPIAAARHIIDDRLSVRDAESLIARGAHRDQPAASPAIDPDLAAVEHSLGEALGMPVMIRCRAGRGTLTLRFSTLDQLDYLIAQLSNPGNGLSSTRQ